MSISSMVVAVTICFAVVSVHASQDDKLSSNKPNIVEALRCDATFSVLKAALETTGLSDALTASDADLTVFAPTNSAFKAALDALGLSQDELLASEELADILKYHVLSGQKKSSDIKNGDRLATLLGPDIEVSTNGADILINDDAAKVTRADIQVGNGVIHVIDGVLLPPPEPEKLKSAADTKETKD